MLRRTILLALTLSVAAQRGLGQEHVLDQTYGNGVHAFFDGNYTQAVDQLTAAIDGGMRDARAYYFRGLAQSRAGHGLQAEDDFSQGAALESAEPEVTPRVSRALQRVQGQTRLRLEGHRTKARFAALQRQRASDQARYGRERIQERRALTKEADKAATGDEGIFGEKLAPAEGKKAAEAPPGEATEEKPAEKETEAKPADPFGDETEPKTQPAKEAEKPAAKDDIFGEEPKAAEKEMPAEKEEPAAKEETVKEVEEAVTEEEMPKEAPVKIEGPSTKKPADKKA